MVRFFVNALEHLSTLCPNQILMIAQWVFRQYRESILDQIADSAEKTSSGYQLFTNNCQRFSRYLYKHLKFYRPCLVANNREVGSSPEVPAAQRSEISQAQRKDVIISRLERPLKCNPIPHNGQDDTEAIQALCAEISLLHSLYGTIREAQRMTGLPSQSRSKFLPVRLQSILTSDRDMSIIKRFRHKLGMGRPSSFYCFCQTIQVPLSMFILHSLYVEMIKAETLLDIIKERFGHTVR
jgi:hypothetical protein